jgi:cysteine synthase B
MGHEDDIVPAIFDAGVVDRRIDVSTEEATLTSRRLATRGFFVGMSSGAYVHAALRVAADAGARARVVTVLNDTGERYFSTRMWD